MQMQHRNINTTFLQGMFKNVNMFQQSPKMNLNSEDFWFLRDCMGVLQFNINGLHESQKWLFLNLA